MYAHVFSDQLGCWYDIVIVQGHAERSNRAAELRAHDHPVDLAEIEADLARRDALDLHVMAPAPDALVLSNETLLPSQEVDFILARLAEL